MDCEGQVRKSLRLESMTPARKRSAAATASCLVRRRKSARKSLRAQQSMSLHIPIEHLDSFSGMNCFIDLPRQKFSLTYLEANETQNPDSLQCLNDLRGKKLQAYLIGHLHSFTYNEAEISALVKAINTCLKTEFPESSHSLQSEVAVSDDLNPTEHDNQALVISVTERLEEKSRVVYRGYLMSWCNLVKPTVTLLPLLLCHGSNKIKYLVHRVLSEHFDVVVSLLTLSQEDFIHLSTYCLVMLDQNDTYPAIFSFKIPSGHISLTVCVQHLLKLWNNIHEQENGEIDLDEVLMFHDALLMYCESTFGLKLDSALYEGLSVRDCFQLQMNTRIWSKSTKIIHVILKYMNYLAVQKLKVKKLSFLDQSSVANQTC